MGKSKKFNLMAVVVLILGLPILIVSSAHAAETLKIATLTDMSGPYAELAGWGNINAAKMAIEDFGGKVLGMDIEYVYRDHQCKADLANKKAIELYEKEKADVIFDCPNSASGLAVTNQALKYKKIFIAITYGTTRHMPYICATVTHFTGPTTTMSSPHRPAYGQLTTWARSGIPSPLTTPGAMTCLNTSARLCRRGAEHCSETKWYPWELLTSVPLS